MLGRVQMTIVLMLMLGASVAGVYAYGHSTGAEKASRQFQERIDAETARQREINERLRVVFDERVRELNERLEAQDDQIDELLREAANDPSAGRNSIGADSVRRLNSVQ